MKKIFILPVAIFSIAILFNSCKKSSDNKPVTTASSMKLTLNGTALSYNTCLASDATVGSSKQTLVTGLNLTNNTPGNDSFELDIMHDIATLKAGEVFPASTSFGQSDSMALIYFPNSTDTFETQPANAQGTVTITSVDSGVISGTFSGKLFADNDLSGTTLKYTVTSGTFTARTK